MVEEAGVSGRRAGSSHGSPYGSPHGSPHGEFRFLAEASRLLADSLDYETTLATVATLSLPHFGAWCIIDLLIDGGMHRAAVIHGDADQQALARRLQTDWPPQQDDPFGVPRAMRTCRTEVIAHLPDSVLVEVARSPQNLEVLRSLGMGSLLVVPLLARGEVLGAVTYVSPRAGRVHTRDDVELAEDLAARCAIALDNARLYRDARQAWSQAESARTAAEDARSAAEEANEVKTQFLRTMSHELRTPLNSISAYVGLLQMGIHGDLTEQQQENLRRIQVAQRHLLTVVTQVLDYAQAGAQRMKYDIRTLRLREVVDEVETVMAPMASARKVALPVLSDRIGAGATVRADADKLAQILVNLLTNAVKFTPAGGSVDLECTHQDGSVELRITDSGIGIAAGDHERIFEPFIQVENTLTRAESGTGLGLAISRDFARAMAGDLTVSSEPGRGSTFTLRLPAGD